MGGSTGYRQIVHYILLVKGIRHKDKTNRKRQHRKEGEINLILNKNSFKNINNLTFLIFLFWSLKLSDISSGCFDEVNLQGIWFGNHKGGGPANTVSNLLSLRLPGSLPLKRLKRLER